jgi:hypothetical protein
LGLAATGFRRGGRVACGHVSLRRDATAGIRDLPAGRRYVLCAIDRCSLCNSTYDLFRRKVAEGAGTEPARVAVHTVHQHTALLADNDAYRLLLQTKDPPACPDLKFFDQTADKLGAVVNESLGRLQPFDRIGAGESKVDRVASTRRLIEKDGKVHRPRWSLVTGRDLPLRDEPEGLIDPMLNTITPAQATGRWCACTTTPPIRRVFTMIRE